MFIYRCSGKAVATCIDAHIEWIMHTRLHVMPTHACVIACDAYTCMCQSYWRLGHGCASTCDAND